MLVLLLEEVLVEEVFVLLFVPDEVFGTKGLTPLQPVKLAKAKNVPIKAI